VPESLAREALLLQSGAGKRTTASRRWRQIETLDLLTGSSWKRAHGKKEIPRTEKATA